MGNQQGRKHKRRNRRPRKPKIHKCDKLVFVDYDDDEYIRETHVFGRLPLKEPQSPEIVFYGEKLWQDDDGWNMVVLIDKNNVHSNELSDDDIVEI